MFWNHGKWCIRQGGRGSVAEIRPFRGVRYNRAAVDNLASVVAAPYDIITPAAQEAYHRRDAHNVVRLELGDERAGDTPAQSRYTRSAALYRAWLRSGIVAADADTGFYLSEEQFDDGGRSRTRRSLFVALRLATWDERIVLPHEHTSPGPKVDRLNLLATAHAQFSPLLGMYDDPGGVLDLLAAVAATPPTVEFTLPPGWVAAAADRHRLWHLAAPSTVARLVEAFRSLQIYVADGHHRYETALAYRDRVRQSGAGPNAPSEFVLLALVETGDPGMLVLPTHRLLRGLGAIDVGQVVRLLGERFDVERLPLEQPGGSASPASPNPMASARRDGDASRPSFTLLGLEESYAHRLTLRPSVDLARELPDVPDVLRALDTVILQKLIFEPVFGLSEHEMETGERIQYTRDPDEARRAFTSGQAQLAVFLDPTSMAQIRAASKAGQRMPQKSTYFYPKPVTGLVFFDHEVAF